MVSPATAPGQPLAWPMQRHSFTGAVGTRQCRIPEAHPKKFRAVFFCEHKHRILGRSLGSDKGELVGGQHLAAAAAQSARSEKLARPLHCQPATTLKGPRTILLQLVQTLSQSRAALVVLRLPQRSLGCQLPFLGGVLGRLTKQPVLHSWQRAIHQIRRPHQAPQAPAAAVDLQSQQDQGESLEDSPGHGPSPILAVFVLNVWK
mmetsp:Transcript_53049/g.141085  ORF Transcript_53049/g.141085 Transcript_53049/m.141085 type:complete len:204 (+) Transcript_53049:504-1115(+)